MLIFSYRSSIFRCNRPLEYPDCMTSIVVIRTWVCNRWYQTNRIFTHHRRATRSIMFEASCSKGWPLLSFSSDMSIFVTTALFPSSDSIITAVIVWRSRFVYIYIRGSINALASVSNYTTRVRSYRANIGVTSLYGGCRPKNTMNNYYALNLRFRQSHFNGMLMVN